MTVTIVNTGMAGAVVPFTVSFDGGETVQRIEVRGKAKAITRVEVPGLPHQVVVNDGSVPESDLTQQYVYNHVAVVPMPMSFPIAHSGARNISFMED